MALVGASLLSILRPPVKRDQLHPLKRYGTSTDRAYPRSGGHAAAGYSVHAPAVFRTRNSSAHTAGVPIYARSLHPNADATNRGCRRPTNITPMISNGIRA
jgi:hypothetical protein